MKTPGEVSARLAAQWRRAALRMARLGSAEAWPLRLPIGRPTALRVERDPERVRAHVMAWHKVEVGQVEWQEVRYRGTGVAVSVPVYWRFNRPSEWVAAAALAEKTVAREYAALSRLCAVLAPVFHGLLIGRFSLWQGTEEATVLQAARIAEALAPGAAGGKPLRALSLCGADTKFFEKNRALIVAFLDALHEGAASHLGLEIFLDAAPAETHWVLCVDLDGALLPFSKQRVCTRDLAVQATLPGRRLLVVENEHCLHQLPSRLPGTLAILGCGLDLAWLGNPALADKSIAYWGDLDTWGLRMLGLARAQCSALVPLLMDETAYSDYSAGRAVHEPVAAELPPEGSLNEAELALFEKLRNLPLGRLEQEFLPGAVVLDALSRWVMTTSNF